MAVSPTEETHTDAYRRYTLDLALKAVGKTCTQSQECCSTRCEEKNKGNTQKKTSNGKQPIPKKTKGSLSKERNRKRNREHETRTRENKKSKKRQ